MNKHSAFFDELEKISQNPQAANQAAQGSVNQVSQPNIFQKGLNRIGNWFSNWGQNKATQVATGDTSNISRRQKMMNQINPNINVGQ